MTYSKHLLAQLFLCLVLSSTSLFSQSIEWEYEVQDELTTNAGNFWIDDDGNGFFNIRRSKVQRHSSSGKESFLLKLNRHGQYDGSVVVNQCKSLAPMYPFGKNRFITSGNNCNQASTTGRNITTDTRVFNQRGKLLKVGEAFPGFTTVTGAVCHDDEVTFFNKPNNDWGYSFLSIGKVNEEVEISYDSISLAELTHDEYGIMLASRRPVITNNETWAVPCTYGDVTGKYNERIELRHGILLGIKEQEIQWSYPSELDDRTIGALCVQDDKVGMIRSPRWGKDRALFIQLGEDGSLLKSIPINASSVRGMGMTDDFFVVMERTQLKWFSMEGELEATFLLAEHGLNTPLRMQMLKDGSLVFSARRGKDAVIMKLRNDQLELIEEEAPEPRAVSYSSVEEASSETISIAVYPNPASIDITFEVEQEVDISAGFLLQIFGASGQLVHEAEFNSQRHEVYVNELPAGTYFYRIAYQQDQERRLIQGKFVKV